MISETMLKKLSTPQPLTHMTSRLPGKFARTNAALIASVTKRKALESVRA